VAGEEGRDLADAIGDGSASRFCRCWGIGAAQVMQGDLAGAAAQFGRVLAEADADHDVLDRYLGLQNQSFVLTFRGDADGARAAAAAAVTVAGELGGVIEGSGYGVLALAALAAGDLAAATDASEAARRHIGAQRELAPVNLNPVAQIALARGDLVAARHWADHGVAVTTGWHLARARITRARVALAHHELGQAERDAHDALAIAADVQAYLGVADMLECLASLAGEAGSYREAARLFGAAEAIRNRTGEVRFKIYNAGCEASVAAVHSAMGDVAFESAWAEGAELSTEEAIAYAHRGRGERRRPTSGWASLTPTERDVIRLVSEEFANKDVAARLFVSPRTVQTHLTHVYTKLAVSSRVQLAQEAARHA
jgi:DNA-binding CsgD family transcriptional regulator